jgi:hypothetical protein
MSTIFQNMVSFGANQVQLMSINNGAHSTVLENCGNPNRNWHVHANIDFRNFFFGLNTLNFQYISEELTDKYNLRKSILACNWHLY